MDNNELNVEAFWERLTQISKSRNKTQIAFCADLGFDLQQFRNKKSMGSFPTLEQLVKLSNYFGVPLNYMLTGETLDETESLEEQIEEYQAKIAELEVYKTKFEKLKEIINDSSSLPSSE